MITRDIRKEIVMIKRYDIIINEKLIDYLYNKIHSYKEKFVFNTVGVSYETITKELIRKLLENNKECEESIVILSDFPEYDNCPFEVEHASAYNHRWEGDYDPDAYDDWKPRTYCLHDFFYQNIDFPSGKPVYLQYFEMFDWKERE